MLRSLGHLFQHLFQNFPNVSFGSGVINGAVISIYFAFGHVCGHAKFMVTTLLGSRIYV
jgi:hypothetical protein